MVIVSVGCGSSLLVFIFTHRSKPPSARFLVIVWAVCAFYMCVLWIYTLAGELVALLSSIGSIIGLSPSFLGLTIMAWGNSLGDLFTNTAVAKQGLGEMALAGCYAGPVFNILMGFGISLVFASSFSYPESLDVHFDMSAVLSLVFLIISLVSTILIVSIKGFKIDRMFGSYLISIYVFYTVCQAALVLLT
jgi:sodium/potassium/calcium exchanger 6